MSCDEESHGHSTHIRPATAATRRYKALIFLPAGSCDIEKNIMVVGDEPVDRHVRLRRKRIDEPPAGCVICLSNRDSKSAVWPWTFWRNYGSLESRKLSNKNPYDLILCCVEKPHPNVLISFIVRIQCRSCSEKHFLLQPICAIAGKSCLITCFVREYTVSRQTLGKLHLISLTLSWQTKLQ